MSTQSQALTRNTLLLRQQVAEHIAADQVVQAIYWDEETRKGCFIGCLAHSSDPALAEQFFGLPIMVQRIAESIFEALPAEDAKLFFASLPDAVACDGKNLNCVGWQFLAAELRSLPEVPADVQAVIDPVIVGMDLLASGQPWPAAKAAEAARTAARAAQVAAWAAKATAARAAEVAAWATAEAAWAAESAAWAAVEAAWAASAAAWAAKATAEVARAAARAAAAKVASAASRRRQRDLLLRLISEAPVMEMGRQSWLEMMLPAAEPPCKVLSVCG